MVSKVRNFWLCVFSGVVATTLIPIIEEIDHQRKMEKARDNVNGAGGYVKKRGQIPFLVLTK